MKKALPIVAVAAILAAAVTPTPVQARNDGAIVGGVLGGLALGAIVGSAVARPRPYYYEPVYEPGPVYVVPERRTCVEEREVWSNRYQQYVIRSVRVPCY
jgi:hypothetical protein